MIRDQLYHDFPFYGKNIEERQHLDSLIQHIHQMERDNKGNKTLRTVASLCAVWNEQKKTYTRNARIHAVINFNIDAVLRNYVYARYNKLLLRTIERASKSPDPEKISVYHMHGFLRFDKKANNLGKEAYDKLVLAEQEYFDFFNRPTTLFNYTFLYLLREYPCLFIGLSMKDDNIRRLLHYSKSEREQAYIDEGESLGKAKEKSLRHFSILKGPKDCISNKQTEQSLKELGVSVLWVNSFVDLPEKISQLYEAVEEDWESVFETRDRHLTRHWSGRPTA